MNKVTNIEIAGQVFSIEEKGFDVLNSYIKRIRLQLGEDSSSMEILQDIELRIAELLYAFSANNGAITLEQVEQVIEQVGYIDSEDDESEIERKSFLDTQNKILGGVCAGLAVRFQVPAFILRVIFLALGLLFGAGVVLYIIFWVSMKKNNSRNAALAAIGKSRTAKQLALYEEIEEPKPMSNFFHTLQRILYQPKLILSN